MYTVSRSQVVCVSAVRRVLAVGISILMLALAFAPIAASDVAASGIPVPNIESATTWLLSQQAEDGGFVGFSGESDPGATVDAVLALSAAQLAGIEVDLDEAMTYLESQALVYSQVGPGSAAKLVLAIVATGGDPHDIGNVDPLSIVEVAASSGQFGGGPFDAGLGLLALAATDLPVPAPMLESLTASQIADGSWSFDGTNSAGTGDTNTTAIVLQGLVAIGDGDSDQAARALAYLSAAGVEGAFPYQPGSEIDANSTSLVVQALVAVDKVANAAAIEDGVRALLQLQNESGALAYMASAPDDNLFATMQALPAMAQVAFPLLPADVLATPVAA